MKLKTLIHRRIRTAIHRTVTYHPLYEYLIQYFSNVSSILDLPEVGWAIPCEPTDVLLDLGANVGNITSRLAKTRAIVYAFEPDPVAYRILSRRFSLIDNVICFNKGVMTEPGYLELFPCKPKYSDRIQASVGSSFLAQKNQAEFSLGKVACVSLCEFITQLNVPIKFIKMDIEGAEVDVLNSLIDTGVHRKVYKIAVETHDEQIESLRISTDALRKKIAANDLSEKINLGWL